MGGGVHFAHCPLPTPWAAQLVRVGARGRAEPGLSPSLPQFPRSASISHKAKAASSPKGPPKPSAAPRQEGKRARGPPPKHCGIPSRPAAHDRGGCRGGSPVPGAAHVGAQSGTGRKRRSGSGEEQWKERAPGAADSKLPLRERGKEKESSSRRGAARVLPPAAWGGPVCLPAPWGGGCLHKGPSPTLCPHRGSTARTHWGFTPSV